MEMWRFGVKDAAKLCLWLVEVLQKKTKIILSLYYRIMPLLVLKS